MKDRLPLVLLVLILAAVRAAAPPGGTATTRDVRVLTIEGVINAVTARYLMRGLEEAADARAELVVLRLNTPGGLETAMREMTEAILGSPVPVAVLVAPPGARAASAGMWLTLAGHVAAMAPGTAIGAAHPVGLGAQTDPVVQDKLVNDAAAFARAVANARGRNAEWAELAVRESVSITAEEALEQRVIDLIARDLPDLLLAIDGREIETAVREVTLRTADAPVVELPMALPERILLTFTDPNIAYILFTLGVIGLIAELYNPGLLFPGITGAISLVIAFLAFGSLPINWAAVLLIGFAVALFVAELQSEGIGVLGAGGLIAFVLGSLMLYTPFTPVSPVMADVRVSPWLVTLMTAGFAAFFAFVLRAVVRAQRGPVATGIQALAGRVGVARSDLAPEGTVLVDSEVWRARAEDGGIGAGERVEVAGVEGVTLLVRKHRPARKP